MGRLDFGWFKEMVFHTSVIDKKCLETLALLVCTSDAAIDE
jgi:hypothetical protein